MLAITASECPDEGEAGAGACVGWCVWLAIFALFDLGSGLGSLIRIRYIRGGRRRLDWRWDGLSWRRR